ncbi:MAG: hypothetical protein DRO90_01055 [Candidatus Altiarchaeales archaeon]|nr:MAG: hypothetical protein DRO90_01055 [Candidatus Altiarchaeales archaeon]
MQNYDVVVVGSGPSGLSAAFTCANLNLDVLVIEKFPIEKKHKICGGMISPMAEKYISEIFEREIPSRVMSSPNKVSIFMVSPSGKSGKIKGEKLINVERDNFDRWLLELIEKEGVHIQDRTTLTKIDENKITVRRNGKEKIIKARYIIGADGVFSLVRRNIAPEIKFKTIAIAQEFLKRENIKNRFYMFFNKDFSPTYIYLVPKRDYLLFGNGILNRDMDLMQKSRLYVEKYLCLEFEVIGMEQWFIPRSKFLGKGDVLLVGDAAGLCNAFSGEGIRLAIKSGYLAGKAIYNAINLGKNAIDVYRNLMREVIRYVDKTIRIHRNFLNMGNEDLEGLILEYVAPLIH